jgi:hypothetical protein
MTGFFTRSGKYAQALFILRIALSGFAMSSAFMSWINKLDAHQIYMNPDR